MVYNCVSPFAPLALSGAANMRASVSLPLLVAALMVPEVALMPVAVTTTTAALPGTVDFYG